ncbi:MULTISPECIES: hypothetical protein [unclassified Sphingomonas]|jgi:hypothetical protein|uniref:hypothetical protein n=1 Tax=unclassified Sphingomonas TaxID=196159 RepID=UPI0012E35F13|nr:MULTISPECIES: hypothetical protein [unclassified Sphingomonas]
MNNPVSISFSVSGDQFETLRNYIIAYLKKHGFTLISTNCYFHYDKSVYQCEAIEDDIKIMCDLFNDAELVSLSIRSARGFCIDKYFKQGYNSTFR